LCLSGVGYVDGRVLVVLCGRKEHNNNIFGRRFGVGNVFFVFFICVDARSFCGLLCVVCALCVIGVADSMICNMAAVWRELSAATGGVFTGLLCYSYLEESGWSSSAGVALLLDDLVCSPVFCVIPTLRNRVGVLLMLSLCCWMIWSRQQFLGHQIYFVSTLEMDVQRFKRTSILSVCHLLQRMVSKN
jgi:hypothetical protein